MHQEFLFTYCFLYLHFAKVSYFTKLSKLNKYSCRHNTNIIKIVIGSGAECDFVFYL